LVDLGLVSGNIRDVGIRMSGDTVEIAEFAIRYADIRGVHVPVDDPGHLAVGNLFLTELVGNEH
jgi:hypothetical protein